MVEIVVVTVIILAALTYTTRIFYRILAGRRKACGCEDDCSISSACDTNDERCLVAKRMVESIDRRRAERVESNSPPNPTPL